MNTPAMIFDMRGYPNGTAWALFRRPFQGGLGFDEARDALTYAFE